MWYLWKIIKWALAINKNFFETYQRELNTSEGIKYSKKY